MKSYQDPEDIEFKKMLKYAKKASIYNLKNSV